MEIVDERIVNNMSDKHFNNKISLWIKQRLFISRRYDETMGALEKFASEMKASDDLQAAESQQRAEEKQQPDDDDERRRLSSIAPALPGETSLGSVVRKMCSSLRL